MDITILDHDELMNILKKQILGFLFAGCSANIISFIFYVLFYKIFHFSIISSSIFGQCLGVFTNYAINSRIVFRKNLGLKMKTIYCSYYGLSIFFVGLFIEALINMGIEYRISWLIAILSISILNFIFVKFLAFKN